MFLPSLCIVQPVVDFELRTIFIKKVSPSQAEHLRGLSRQMGRVRNFLPLLNKVSIPPAGSLPLNVLLPLVPGLSSLSTLSPKKSSTFSGVTEPPAAPSPLISLPS